jgi:adenosylcobinamide kinase/adenosylcobinamide-phosphate guanylyltransferase
MAKNRTTARTHLVLGGARSGKTAHGLALADAYGLEKWLVATAEASDAEMRDRIALHRAERDDRWRVVEEPLALRATLTEIARPDRIVLVDCLTIWLSNLFFKDCDHAAEIEQTVAVLADLQGPAIFVSNELGLGLAPDTALGRSFRDAHGRMNQQFAARCENVTFVAAGLPMRLKSDR